jgi:flagellin
LDQEVTQRIAEIDRVTAQTSFNGQKLLDGSFGKAAFQVGANVSETISVDLSSSMRATNIGRLADYVNTTAFDVTKAIGAQGAGVGATTPAAGDLSISVGNATAVSIAAPVAGVLAGQAATSAYAKVAAINGAGVAGLTATADTTLQMAYVTNTAAFTLAINGTTVVNAAGAGLTGSSLAQAINQNSGATGVTASFTNGNMTLNAADGRNISITQTDATAAEGFMGVTGTNNTANTAAFTTATQMATGVAVVAYGSIRLTAADRIAVTEANAGAAAFGMTAGALALGASSLSSQTVSTVNGANSTIASVDSALSTVSSLRGTFGAIQNRFDSVIANLGSSVENLSSSRSRILDADFATETANLSRSQILQQAGTAMVAQANQLPQGVLALLK